MRAKSSLTDRHTHASGQISPRRNFRKMKFNGTNGRSVCPKQSHKRFFVEVVPGHGQNYQNFPQDCSDGKSQPQVGNQNHRWEIKTTGGKSEIRGKSEPQVEIKHHNFWFRIDKSGTLCEQKCVFLAYICDMYLCVQCNCQEDKKRYSKSLWRGSWV